jgi:PAS domain S-box-containing protein
LWAYVVVVAGLWTLVVAVSLISNLRQQRQETLEVAREAARSAYEKDVAYRRWNAQHGGVYVPITEKTPSNPYLQVVADRSIDVLAVPLNGTEDDGLALTLVNPAYMTRQVHEISAEAYGVQGHITSLNPIRPANAPDPWEREALQAFEEDVTEVSEVREVDGARVMRLMRPLITEQSCLTCHAEQGYEVGDVRGGISVSIPMAGLQTAARKHVRVSRINHGVLWVVGLAIIGGGGYALQDSVKSLQESEARHRSLIRAVQAAIVVHDADGRVVASNPAAQQILGLSATQLTGRSARDEVWQFVREDGTPLPVEGYPVNEVFAADDPVRDRVVGIQNGGNDEVTWALVNAAPIRGEDGEIVQVIVTFMDITARQRAEREVVRQRDMLENTLESLTHPFFVVNVGDYTIEMANSASISTEELPDGLTCYAVTHQAQGPCRSEAHPCPLDQVRTSGEPAKVEHVHYAPDGSSRYVEVYGYPIFDETGDVVRMIEYTLDVTERRRAQKELAEQTAALARSNAELEEFAYIASHDLQEPLRKVQAFGDRLQSRYGDVLDARGRDYLARMQHAALRMRWLIDDLLIYSRVTTKPHSFETVVLNEVVAEVTADLVVCIEETGGRVEVSDLPAVDADRVQMRQMLQNLIGNALKFHREGVPPVVKVHAEVEASARDPVLEDIASGGVCRLSIEDNGIGFDTVYAKQIFAPFKRLHGRADYEGTGMGLAICRKIVTRHSGEIEVESTPGEGATFIVHLPIVQVGGEESE